MSSPFYRSIDNLASLTNTNLGLEASRAETVESALFARLSAYMTSNDSAVNTLSQVAASSSDAETTRATAAEAAISSSFATAQSAITDLQSQNSGTAAALTGFTSQLSNEATRATAAEMVLTQNLDSTNQTIGTIVRSRSADAGTIYNLQVSCNTLTSQIADEATRATAAESLTQSAIGAEGSRAAAAEMVITQNLDSTNQTIGTIVRSRSADAGTIYNLQVSCSSLTSQITNEATRAGAAETAAQTAVTDEATRATTAEAAEAARAGAAETALSASFTGLSTTLDSETTRATAAEAGLNQAFASQSASIQSVVAAQSNTDAAVAALTASMNAQDVTLAGVWSNTGHTSYQANMRVVRNGGCVTVTLSAFNSAISTASSACTYSLPVPSWAVPDFPVECSVVVSTSGNSSSGCAVSDSTGVFSIFPFNGSWGESGGINYASCFTYTLSTGSVAQSGGSIDTSGDKRDDGKDSKGN